MSEQNNPTTVAEIEQWYRGQLEAIYHEAPNTIKGTHPGMVHPGGGNMAMGSATTTLQGQLIRERLNSIERERTYYYEIIGYPQGSWYSQHTEGGHQPTTTLSTDSESSVGSVPKSASLDGLCEALKRELYHISGQYLEVEFPEDLEELELSDYVILPKMDWFKFEALACQPYLNRIKRDGVTHQHFEGLGESISWWYKQHQRTTELIYPEADTYLYIQSSRLNVLIHVLEAFLEELGKSLPSERPE